jgi:hypothetical protein
MTITSTIYVWYGSLPIEIGASQSLIYVYVWYVNQAFLEDCCGISWDMLWHNMGIYRKLAPNWLDPMSKPGFWWGRPWFWPMCKDAWIECTECNPAYGCIWFPRNKTTSPVLEGHVGFRYLSTWRYQTVTNILPTACRTQGIRRRLTW